MKKGTILFVLVCFVKYQATSQSFTFDPSAIFPFQSKTANTIYGDFSTSGNSAALNFNRNSSSNSLGTRVGQIATIDNKFKIYAYSDGNDLSIGQEFTPVIYFKTLNDYIGFGNTTNPRNLFHFHKANSGITSEISSSQLMKIENNQDAFLNFSIPDDKKAGIQFSKPGNLFVGSIRLTEGNAMDFRVNENNTKMRISSTGNVSIGRGSTGSFSGAGLLHINSNGTDTTRFIISQKYPTVTKNFEMSLDSINTAKILNQRDGQLVLGTNTFETIRINRFGNVGIQESQSAVNASLHINRGTPGILLTRTSDSNNGLSIKYSNADIAEIVNQKNNSLRFGTNNAIKMILSSSGQLLVGDITSPSAILHVHQAVTTAKTVLKVTNGLSGAIGTDGFDVGFEENTLNSRVWNNENGSISIGTNNVERMAISNTGNIGIGVSPNTAKLSINGDFALNKITSNTSTGTLNNVARNGSSILRISGTGNIILSGIESAPDGTMLYIITTSTVSQLTFTNNGGSSLDENKILSGNSTPVLGDGAVTLIYDGTSQRWRVVSVHQ